jgi:single-strand selective monofunctional uracil DNA glycosylase
VRFRISDFGFRRIATINGEMVTSSSLVSIARELGEAVDELRFAPPVAHVYNPLDYAWPAHAQYLERFGAGRREVLLLGMNPGPWGMVQTGVPFGQVTAVRDWLGINAPIMRPAEEHPKRPVNGFGCHRSELSGERLWGWAREVFGTPERFFDRFFVANYCPLSFMEPSGRNRTPDKLPAFERKQLFALCDDALRRAVMLLRPGLVVGVGAFAEQRAGAALAGLQLRIGRVLHPSPASPAANRGWSARATQQMRELGIRLP